MRDRFRAVRDAIKFLNEYAEDLCISLSPDEAYDFERHLRALNVYFKRKIYE